MNKYLREKKNSWVASCISSKHIYYLYLKVTKLSELDLERERETEKEEERKSEKDREMEREWEKGNERER